MSLLFWWRWCHCLGHALAERAHAIHLFSTVSFTEKSAELGGFDSTLISPTPALPPPLPSSPLCSPPLPVCHTLTPVFAFPLLLIVMSSSISVLLQCHLIPPLIHSICPSVSPSLLPVSLPLSPHEMWGLIELERNVSVFESFSLHISWVCACVHKERSERWIEVSSSRWEINIHMAVRLWLLTCHKNSCSNI